MVYLNRIYTKTGDAGETSLGDGSRVPKTDPRIAAYGTVDELNALLGVVCTVLDDAAQTERLRCVQNDLFDAGADLCVPESGGKESESPQKPAASSGGSSAGPSSAGPLRVTEQQVQRLEEWIDETNAHLAPLSSFVLPGGSPAAAYLHLARTVCRRAEIAVWQLAAREPVNPRLAVYLNRLSDWLFVLARAANNKGRDDVLWIPGGERKVADEETAPATEEAKETGKT